MRKQFLVRLSNWFCFLKLHSLKNFADVGPCRFSGTKTILLLQLLPVFALPSEQKYKLHEGRTDMAFTLKWCNFTCRHRGRNFLWVCWVSWSHDGNCHSIYWVQGSLHVLFDFSPSIQFENFKHIEELQKYYSEYSIQSSSRFICYNFLHAHTNTHTLFFP